MKKIVMVLMMVFTMMAGVFADAKSDAKASMEKTRVERQEDFDAWLNAINAEIAAKDAEFEAAMAEIEQQNKELRDAVRKAHAEKALKAEVE